MPPSQAGVRPSVGDGDASAQPNASSTSCTDRVSVTRVWFESPIRCCDAIRTRRSLPAPSGPPAAADTPGRTCRCRSGAAGCRSATGSGAGRRASCSGCSAPPGWMSPAVSWRKSEPRRIGEELRDEAGLLFGGERAQRVHEVLREARIVLHAGPDPLVGDARQSSPRCARRSARSAGRSAAFALVA